MRRLNVHSRRPTWGDFLATSAASRLLPVLAFCTALGLSIGALAGDSGSDVRAAYIGAATALVLLVAIRVLYGSLRDMQGELRLGSMQAEHDRLIRVTLELTRLQLELKAAGRSPGDAWALASHTEDADARRRATVELEDFAASVHWRLLHPDDVQPPVRRHAHGTSTSFRVDEYEYALELSKLLTEAAADTIDRTLQHNPEQESLPSQ